MADEETTVKDPTKKRFWSFGNVFKLVMTVVAIPAVTWITNEAIDAYRTFSGNLETLNDRIKDLERDHANNQAIWSAINDSQKEAVEMRIKYEAAMLVFNHEYAAKFPSVKPPPSGTVEQPIKPPPPVKPPPVTLKAPNKDRIKWLQDTFGVTEAQAEELLKGFDATSTGEYKLDPTDAEHQKLRELYEKRYPGIQRQMPTKK